MKNEIMAKKTKERKKAWNNQSRIDKLVMAEEYYQKKIKC